MKKVQDIYTNSIIKDMYNSALVKEKLKANQLKSTLKKFGLTTKYSKLDKLLEEFILSDEAIEKQRYIGLNSKTQSAIIESKGQKKEINLSDKIYKELLSLAQTGAAPSQLVGFIYEQQVFDIIENNITGIIKNELMTPSYSARYLNARPSTDSKFDIIISLPYGNDINNKLTYEDREKIKEGLALDVKSQLSDFYITSASDRNPNFYNSMLKELYDIPIGTQMSLYTDIKELFIIMGVKHKLQEAPVFVGALDNNILLTSQMLTRQTGEFYIEGVDLSSKDVSDEIKAQAAKINGKKSEERETYITNLAVETIIRQIQKRSLKYMKY